MADMGWSRRIADQEAIEYAKCFDEAAKHGIAANQAEECDNGSLGCANCPWKEQFIFNCKD